MSGSEITRIREQHELERQAAQRGLEGFAIITTHLFITKRMEQMWDAFQQLAEEVGQTEAQRIAFGEPPSNEDE